MVQNLNSKMSKIGPEPNLTHIYIYIYIYIERYVLKGWLTLGVHVCAVNRWSSNSSSASGELNSFEGVVFVQDRTSVPCPRPIIWCFSLKHCVWFFIGSQSGPVKVYVGCFIRISFPHHARLGHVRLKLHKLSATLVMDIQVRKFYPSPFVGFWWADTSWAQLYNSRLDATLFMWMIVREWSLHVTVRPSQARSNCKFHSGVKVWGHCKDVIEWLKGGFFIVVLFGWWGVTVVRDNTATMSLLPKCRVQPSTGIYSSRLGSKPKF